VIALVTGASSGIGESPARNHAGDSWRARVADGGWENVGRTMALNFDAVVRLTEALLALLRASAPSSIVNVSERHVPRPYAAVAALRMLAPGLVRRAQARVGT